MRIAVIGGDKRMLFAAKGFLHDGHEVCLAGFDSLLSLCELKITDCVTAALWAELIVLPVRPLKGAYLNAPYMTRSVKLDSLLQAAGETPVFCGGADLLRPLTRAPLFDYTLHEDFLYRNAELTAEGALSILLSDYEGAVFGSEILVTGYGRIGKLLCRMLCDLGARVTAAARKPSDRAMIRLSGMQAADFGGLDWGRYAIIVNTVPAVVMDSAAVDRMRSDVFLIDLASAPGGVDFVRAKERGLTCLHALALPGKTAPLTAGMVIKDTVMTILSGSAITGSV